MDPQISVVDETGIFEGPITFSEPLEAATRKPDGSEDQGRKDEND